ncbi:MAG: metallophosphoesterase [Winogradskyella sp.]
MNSFSKCYVLIFAAFIFTSCATLKRQVKENTEQQFPFNKEIEHSFYLIGDAGKTLLNFESETINAFQNELNKASKNSTALFLGDNIYENGMPPKTHHNRDFAEHQLNTQTKAVKNFKGKTVFIPGNHDWYSGINGLKEQEKFIENILGKDSFLPENGCPLEKVNVTEKVVLIVVDTEWYITDWNQHPTINDDCEIKTRAKFFDELEGLIKKARGKTTLIALHHPMFTNGSHNGQFSFKSHIKPLPILGTLKNIVRKASGLSPADMQNTMYNELRKRIITLSQENEKVIFVSGHEHSLQYIVKDNLPQIVSGSGSKTSATRNVGGGQFSYGVNGYARLDVFKDGSSHVRFYSDNSNSVLFQTEVLPANKKPALHNYPLNFASNKQASIYTKKEITKSNIYKAFWGERYRKYFGTKVNAPVVSLDTLYGGITIVRKGGGHQSKSLRFKDKQGREYVMRALRKNALQYLQAVAFKDQFIEGQFDDTLTQDLLLDVFTGSHPYAPFTIATLANAVGVYHTNPKLYYIPKQNALGDYNEGFGDELYMIEERAGDGHGDKASFGFSNELISTDDLLKKLNKDEDHILDEASYIRARLFDMLIGDWDRHEDQWRWAVFSENGKTIYRPVPRDRDQAFSIMSNGALLGFATSVIPSLRLMKSYDVDLKSPKWFNLAPYPLDMALINQSNKSVWDAEVKQIVAGLTDAVIDEAFLHFPKEVNDNTVKNIKRKLKGRRANLQNISNNYYAHINKYAVIKGTNKDDWFDIERLPNGQTKVTAYRIKKGKKGVIFHQRTYASKVTKEIWVYGLDDDDVFKVIGNGDQLMPIRLIGGQNNDTYNVQNGSKVFVYDYKSKNNKFLTNNGKIKLTDDYKTNVYDYKKLKNSANQLMPSIGSNPDDGLKIGLKNTFTTFGFERNPFTSQHQITAAYYFATQGFDLVYKGEFANIITHVNLGLQAQFTSPNYAFNYFGDGNETINEAADGDKDLDYNRVKIRTFKIAPSLIWRGRMGGRFTAKISYESNEVQRTNTRYIATIPAGSTVFNKQNFYGIDTKYQYFNADNKAFPTLAMLLGVQTGYKNNVSTLKGYGYVIPELSITHRLVTSGQLVFATKLKAHLNIGNNFEFYQGATLGADNGLRGYRNQRFNGKSAFVQSTDLRLNLRKVKTGLLPLNIGVFGGFDYGKVWVENKNSNKWNTSIGAGVFANAADMITAHLSAFNSDDGLRLAFKLGFGF